MGFYRSHILWFCSPQSASVLQKNKNGLPMRAAHSLTLIDLFRIGRVLLVKFILVRTTQRFLRKNFVGAKIIFRISW
jgi:hypothetical protein